MLEIETTSRKSAHRIHRELSEADITDIHEAVLNAIPGANSVTSYPQEEDK